MRTPTPWYEIWMDGAISIARRSKDPNTQVGCYLVSPDNRQHFSGYNGFAAGIPESAERWERPTKYDYVLHAEDNAIAHSKCDLKGWTCYVTLKPCEKCASRIVQAGIAEIIYYSTITQSSNYTLSDSILREANIKVISYKDTYVNKNR